MTIILNLEPEIVEHGPPKRLRICSKIRVGEGQSISEAEHLHAASNCEQCGMSRNVLKTVEENQS